MRDVQQPSEADKLQQPSGPSDPPRQIIHLASGPAAYTDEGEGAVVLAVHGLPGSARDFRWLAPWLARSFRVIRLDLPGFGQTPVATQPDPSPLGRARFVVELTRALALPRPLLLGHSMGGVVACSAAALEPGLFCGLALLSSPGVRPHTMFRRMPFPTLSRIMSQPMLARVLRPAVRRLYALGGFRGYPDAALARTFHCLAATSFDEHAQSVRRLRLPCLVAWCEDDPIIEAEISAELAAACPDGPRLPFSRGGHNPQKSHAQEIAEAVAEWLTDLAVSRAVEPLGL